MRVHGVFPASDTTCSTRVCLSGCMSIGSIRSSRSANAALFEPTWQRVFALACDKLFHFVCPLWCLLLLCVSLARLALGDRAGSTNWVVSDA